MYFEQTVEGLPTGIMTCFVKEQEVGIQEFSPFHIKIRVPEKFLSEIGSLKLIYFHQNERIYKCELLEHIAWQEPEEKEFWWEYCGIVEDDAYQNVISFILKQYYSYVVLKTEAFDNSFSKELTGYPAEKDELYDDDYESWKNRQFQKMIHTDFITKIMELDVEWGISLENAKCWELFLQGDFGKYCDLDLQQKFYRDLYEKSKYLYIGNPYCHHLFPEKELLFQLMKKALKQQKQIVLVFTYLREELLDKTQSLLEEVYCWCQEKNISIEIIVNDWGMLEMLRGKADYFSINYGTLLNRRRKDPRYQYKNVSEKEWKQLEENSLNNEEYTNYLRKKGIKRLEYESSGYRMKLLNMENKLFDGISMHLPLYQTNTSQFCTLYALCENSDRGKQKFVKDCPRYCENYVCMYSQHLQMTGRYNSLFAADWNLFENPGIPEDYKKSGMDRIVWNLM